MDWNKFSEGASKGFDMFISTLKGKDLIDAMKEIKEYFEGNLKNNNHYSI